MNARAEGFEQFVESLFGPKGTSRNFTDNIPILSRFIRDTNSDKALMSKLNTVPNPRKDHTENPQVILDLKSLIKKPQFKFDNLIIIASLNRCRWALKYLAMN